MYSKSYNGSKRRSFGKSSGATNWKNHSNMPRSSSFLWGLSSNTDRTVLWMSISAFPIISRQKWQTA